jgi:hypothetical protein
MADCWPLFLERVYLLDIGEAMSIPSVSRCSSPAFGALPILGRSARSTIGKEFTSSMLVRQYLSLVFPDVSSPAFGTLAILGKSARSILLPIWVRMFYNSHFSKTVNR